MVSGTYCLTNQSFDYSIVTIHLHNTNIIESSDNFDYLKNAFNHIERVGKVYAFKRGLDESEVLEDDEILSKGFSSI